MSADLCTFWSCATAPFFAFEFSRHSKFHWVSSLRHGGGQGSLQEGFPRPNGASRLTLGTSRAHGAPAVRHSVQQLQAGKAHSHCQMKRLFGRVEPAGGESGSAEWPQKRFGVLLGQILMGYGGTFPSNRYMTCPSRCAGDAVLPCYCGSVCSRRVWRRKSDNKVRRHRARSGWVAGESGCSASRVRMTAVGAAVGVRDARALNSPQAILSLRLPLQHGNSTLLAWLTTVILPSVHLSPRQPLAAAL